MTTMSHHPWTRRMLVAVAAALLTVPAVAGSDRFVARVGEPFEIDRHLYPSGTITIRTIRDYMPGSTLNEVWVDRECLGVMLAREDRTSGAVAESDSVVFRRHPSGHLVLVGFSRAGRARSSLYHLERTGRGGRWSPAEEKAEASIVAGHLE